ncbi:interferon-induced protein 44-like [Petromyzon marinus]|uniref:Interferon-induced protein 44-like n=1 Tax=Petromyzon marinus TaxID=7757 RepID=A0AAJ7T3D2_PETMA|nr:interferon-induced protein 44-like [Petromyzon marinus]
MAQVHGLAYLQQRKLATLLGFPHSTLRRLYQGSVDGFTASAFHTKCNGQGPTVTVAYNSKGFIFGGYCSQSLTSRGSYIDDKLACLFRLEEPNNSATFVAKIKSSSSAFYDASSYGPTFGGGHDMHFLPTDGSNKLTFTANIGTSYDATNENILGNDNTLQELEVYILEEMKLLPDPWRSVEWTIETREHLLKDIRGYVPVDCETHPRILLLGHVGSGKSSFVNSIDAVFSGHVSSRAIAGTREKESSFTTVFRSYKLRKNNGRKFFPIHLCDTMGIDKDLGDGINPEDIVSVLQGNVPDYYQFNPLAPIKPSHPVYVKDPALSARTHCLVLVVDACKMSPMPEGLLGKLQDARNKAYNLGIPHLVLLTKVDEACPLVESDINNIYLSWFIKEQVYEIATRLGMPVSSVLPVKNYAVQVQPDASSDLLLIMALHQMLRFADDYLLDQVLSDSNETE